MFQTWFLLDVINYKCFFLSPRCEKCCADWELRFPSDVLSGCPSLYIFASQGASPESNNARGLHSRGNFRSVSICGTVFGRRKRQIICWHWHGVCCRRTRHRDSIRPASSHSWSRSPMAPRCETIRNHSLSGWQVWWFSKHVPMDNTKTRFNIFVWNKFVRWMHYSWTDKNTFTCTEQTHVNASFTICKLLACECLMWTLTAWYTSGYLGDKCVDAMHACLYNIHIFKIWQHILR